MVEVAMLYMCSLWYYFSYGDAVRELDYGVGELLKALDKSGLSNKTLVLFSSDNGASLFSGPKQGKLIY